MENKITRNGSMHLYIKSTLISVVAGELATMLSLLLFALLMRKMDLPLLVSDSLIVLASALGGLTAGFLNGRFIREKGIVFGVICGAVLILIMFLFNVSFHQLTSVAFLIAKLAAILFCSALGGILGVNKKAKQIKY